MVIDEEIKNNMLFKERTSPYTYGIALPWNHQKNIIIKGAREHNLRNINLELPRDSLIVITGLSGSGKSTLPSIQSMRKVSADVESLSAMQDSSWSYAET